MELWEGIMYSDEGGCIGLLVVVLYLYYVTMFWLSCNDDDEVEFLCLGVNLMQVRDYFSSLLFLFVVLLFFNFLLLFMLVFSFLYFF